MSKKSTIDQSKRKALGATAGVAAVVAWHKPIVNSIILPAHAQTSDTPVTRREYFIERPTGGVGGILIVSPASTSKANVASKDESFLVQLSNDDATEIHEVTLTKSSPLTGTTVVNNTCGGTPIATMQAAITSADDTEVLLEVVVDGDNKGAITVPAGGGTLNVSCGK